MKHLIIAAALMLAACGNPGPEGHPDGARGTPLTAAEVRAVFVGQPWLGASGVFRFAPDGTYTYESKKTTTTWGPWRYTINEDGSLTGATATYRFYRIGPSYRYWNSEADAFYVAYPGRTE